MSAVDRRSPSRLVLPTCQLCKQAATVTVASRTDYVLYLRCASCLHVWSIPKPAASASR
jgi:hypothetical protein